VSIERPGGMVLPVEVLVGFDDGSEILETWDGKAAWKDFEYTGTSRAVWAKVDADDKIDLDVNRVNNSWSSDQKFFAARRMAKKFIFLMQVMISLITI
jgi:hypothetical protein